MVKRLLLPAVMVGVLFPVLSVGGRAESETPPVVTADADVATPASPVVTRTVYRHPVRVLRVRSRFHPDARPSPVRVREIIRIEAGRLGVSAAGLARRINCESSFQWDNEYAGHYGLGQFLPGTWQRAITAMPRRVVFVKRRTRAKSVIRLRYWSNGRVVRSPRWRVRQRVVHRYVGMLPARPGIWHGWAQVRAVARAMAGRGGVSSSEWSCGT